MLVLRVLWVLTVLGCRLFPLGESALRHSDGPRYPASDGLAILLKVVGSSLFEGVVHRAWSRSVLPAPLRRSACVRSRSPGVPQEGAGVPGTPTEGRRVYPAQRTAFHCAGAARITCGLVSYLGERGKRARSRRGNGSRPFVRAPGIQGHGDHRYARLARREESARCYRERLRPRGGGG